MQSIALVLALLSSSFAYAGDAPVPVSTYVAPQGSQILVNDPSVYDPTVAEIKSYLDQKNASAMVTNGFNKIGAGMRDYRVSGIPSVAGTTLIRVHKSDDPSQAEYLEVFTLQSDDATDLAPLNLFDNGSSNTALVSTAGTYDGEVYTTPNGDFKFDSLQVMHYSSAYNNAPMPWSMFFNGGIAIHAATGSEIAHLGQKASHGCVRTHPVTAKTLFDYMSDGNSANSVVEVVND